MPVDLGPLTVTTPVAVSANNPVALKLIGNEALARMKPVANALTGEIMKNKDAGRLPEPPETPLRTEDRGDGLTDDQRVSRETTPGQQGPRVQPGPADLERQKKP